MPPKYPEHSGDIQAMADFINRWHWFEFRDEGLPYISHCYGVLRRISRWGVTNVGKHLWVWQTAMGHDLFENTKCVYEDVLLQFGKKVADGIQALTFRPKGFDEPSADYQAYKSAQLDKYAEKPVEIILVKMADRLENVEDFCYTSPNYAPKYFDRASGLFSSASVRLHDIAAEFGQDVVDNMTVDLNRIRQQVEYLRKA